MPEKTLREQLKQLRADLEFAEMQVRVDANGLKRSLEKRARIRKELQRILELLAEKSERTELSEKN